MNRVESFLQTLIPQGLEVWPHEGKLRYAGPRQHITAELLSRLKANKAELLDYFSEPTYAPLSYGQRGLWFIHQNAPNSSAYTVSMAFRIRFQLDIAVMRSAIQLLVDRHAALRTRFVMQGDEVVQQIDGYQQAAIEAADAMDWSDDMLREQVDTFHRQPFDLAQGPLFRVKIWHHEDQSHSIVLSMHHIVVDGWSSYQLIDELFMLYASLTQGRIAKLLPLTYTYCDYVDWQQQLLATDGERLWSYWRSQLHGELPILDLPTDYPRPSQKTLRGLSQEIHFSTSLTQQLKDVAKENGCTLYVVLLAAYLVLLHRYSGQSEICIGLSMAGRSKPEFAEIVGYFTSPVVVRAEFHDNLTFVQFLARLKAQVLTALDHQDYPFSYLVNQLNPRRDSSRSPIYQTSFVLQKSHLDQKTKTELNHYAIEPIPITLFEGQEDISVELSETPDGISGHLKGDAGLFTNTTLERMVGHLQVLVAGIVAESSEPLRGGVTPIAHLPLLTKAERHQLLVAWNTTTTDYPKNKRIHELFEAQVEQTPDAIAVVFDPMTEQGQRWDRGTSSVHSSTLTYRELNNQANRLAHHLQSVGIGPETLVGLCVERSAEMIVSVLGILKAGAAYVPLDPDAPTERLALILEDTQSPVVITQSHLLAHLPSLTNGQQYFCLDKQQELLTTDLSSSLSIDNPVTNGTSQNLAYILYTSGSTGKPKGVCVEHRQVVAYGHAVAKSCQFEPAMRYAMVQPLTVDSSVTMLYPPLWSGGVLHVIDRNHALDPVALAATFAQYEIDCLKIAPSHLNSLRAVAMDPRALLPRKRLIIGGEASQWAWLQELAQEGIQQNRCCQVYNHYGPTETTVGVTTYRVYPDTGAENRLLFTNAPIGYPLANTQAYILNEVRQPVPIGCLGELYIGGDFVARGYLNRPELTQDRFIPNPFLQTNRHTSDGTSPNRLYRTGDWARYLPDGAIAYFGRMDDQVKIHGFRVELGEIESQLLQCPGVQDALVLVRENQIGEKQLVAYIVEDTGKHSAGDPSMSDTTGLRNRLSQTLPTYMIPSTFITLDQMPLTPHGKVDRGALPAPGLFTMVSDEIFVPPSKPIEITLAHIWSDMLGIEQVGIHDNFFERGGHSLLAIRLITDIQRQFGVNLSVKTLFQNPTLGELATALHHQIEDENGLGNTFGLSPESSLIAIQTEGIRLPIFCLLGVGGNVLSLYNLSQYLGIDQPFYGLQTVGLNGEAPPYPSIEQMAAHYIEELKKVQSQGPYLLAGHSFGGSVAFEMVRQLNEQREDVSQLMLLDSYAPGNHERISTDWDKTYFPKSKISTPIILFRADKRLPIRDGIQQDPTLGWRTFAQTSITVVTVPGHHFSMLTEPNVQVLAEKMQWYLTQDKPYKDTNEYIYNS